MPIKFSKDILKTRYKDDFNEDDNYHRILFNPRKALQARELTQLQTIIQKEIERFGKNIFKEGASVSPSGIVIDEKYEYIKIDEVSVPGTAVGDEIFTAQTSGLKFQIVESVNQNTDLGLDATLYVRYINSSNHIPSATPARVLDGEQLQGTNNVFNSKSINATGSGCKISIGEGDFFIGGLFVHAPAQSLIISNYDSSKTTTVGFKISQELITPDDDINLFDNQGATPNISAPGADRLKINLELTTKDKVTDNSPFVFIADVKNSVVVHRAEGHSDYNKINDVLAERTKEEAGNYITQPFLISFDSADASNLTMSVSDGTAYVNGYRADRPVPSKIAVERSQSTKSFSGENVPVSFGNYIIVQDDGYKGLPDLANFSKVTISSNNLNISSPIGTCRVRSIDTIANTNPVEKRVYIFDIVMNAGQSFRSAKSIGVGSNFFAKIKTEDIGGTQVAILKEASNNALLFDLPKIRPQSLSSVAYQVQRYYSSQATGGSGILNLATGSGNDTFANSTEWLFFRSDDGTPLTVIGTPSVGGTSTSITFSGISTSGVNIDALVVVQKTNVLHASKTLTRYPVSGRQDISQSTDDEGNVVFMLNKSDVYEMLEITDATSDKNDISDYFIFDNGQRDGFYEQSRLILKSGYTNPQDIQVAFNYFQYEGQGTGHYFSSQSYVNVPYNKVPKYITSTGKEVDLRNVLDFRPLKSDIDTDNDDDAFANGRRFLLPPNSEVINADITYYQSRNDKIVIDQDGIIKVVKGVPALTPKFPDTPNGTLLLYKTKLNPYTDDGEDVSFDMIETKGYTMKEIGKIEKRIEKLEEIQNLSMLELDTNKMVIADSSGTDRIKSGFIVDNFIDQSNSRYNNDEYRASIDPSTFTLHPPFYQDNVGLIFDSTDADTSNVVLRGDNIYLNYTDLDYVVQDQASSEHTVNSFNAFQNNGSITLSPSSDEWFDNRDAGKKVIKGTNRLSNKPDQLWNSWKWNWIGNDIDGTETTEDKSVTEDTVNSRSFSAKTYSNITEGMGSSEKTIVNRVITSETIRTFASGRIIDVAITPFMRSRKIYFNAVGLRPLTKLVPYFDGVNVNEFVKQESFKRINSHRTEYNNLNQFSTFHPDFADLTTAQTTYIQTDTEGRVSGSFFIPNTASKSFRCGSVEFKLLDVTVDDESVATTKASAIYTAAGALVRSKDRIISTRSTHIINNQSNVSTGRSTSAAPARGRVDPIAQTFLVNDSTGIFITNVSLYFKSKDTSLPVWIEIRPVINGTPSKDIIIPGSRKYLGSSRVATSTDASVPTLFTFDEPIYLDSYREYAICIFSDSKKYVLWTAKTGEFILNSSETRVTNSPSIGSLFKPQNTYLWEETLNENLKFKVQRASFSTFTSDAPAVAIFNNAPIANERLGINSLTAYSDSDYIRVYHPNHGFAVGDGVTLSGVTAWNGITTNYMNDSHGIIARDLDHYVISDNDLSINGTGATPGGGSSIVASKNIQFDAVTPYIETLVPVGTSIDLSGKFTAGKTIVDVTTPHNYVKDTTFDANPLINLQTNYFTSPKVIAQHIKETRLNRKSATIKASLTSDDDRVSPVIDLQRCSLITISNRIDKPSNSSNYSNIALGTNSVITGFVDETDKSNGSVLSKHITNPVNLLTDAVGLKIILQANRPTESSIEVYYKTSLGSELLDNSPYIKAELEGAIPADDDKTIFREYNYLVGGLHGGLDPFTSFVIKIVMTSTNSSKVPTIKDLRAIALAV